MLNLIVGMYVQEKTLHRESLALSVVSGIQWGSWNICPADEERLLY
jgi:hypothetical protein